MDRLKIRADFLRASAGIRRVTTGLTLEMCNTPESAKGEGLRIGFTATKRLGGAVERNRAKRRLRTAAAAVLPLCGRAGNDYVLVARRETLTQPFAQLLDDLKSALRAAHAKQKPTEGRS
jgi:ribonuclease P protein component